MPWPLRPTKRFGPAASGDLRVSIVAEVGQGEMGDAHSARVVSAGSSRRPLTAWPPNWLRSAATAFIAGESSWRETKRAKIDALIVGTGTAFSSASSMVQRPSPESCDVALDVLELRVLLESADEELEQPGPHDGSALPGLEGSGDVLDDVLAGVEELVALGVGLHQRVLDAVVHHLGVVAGADLAHVHEALVARALGAQRVEDRHHALDLLGAAADHEAVAVLETPDAARDTGVHEVDALRRELLGVLEVLGEARVAAVDDEVALLEERLEVGDDGVGDRAGRNHDPDDARGGQGCDEVGERGDIATHRGCVS